MSAVDLTFTPTGNAFQTILGAGDVQPGDSVSYQLCKLIYTYHPLGLKMADGPIKMAQSQERKITIPKGPAERCREAFAAEWKALNCDRHILNLGRLSRVYGVASIALLTDGVSPDAALDYDKLADATVAINVFDPLNTAGSLVLNQDPNAMDFQKVKGIAVQGQAYHRSRTVVLLNEEPIYIEYTGSAFGYVGRSVYQRALYALKTYIQTMITDNLIVIKSGVIIAMLKQIGSIVNNIAQAVVGFKRDVLKQAVTGNVISIGETEKIETLNMQNLEGPYALARKNTLENIATAADMPAKLLNSETFAEGFGEGTEDAKHVAQFVDGVRAWLGPAYTFFDGIVMHRAWNKDFYRQIQEEFPEYRDVPYARAFYDWKNSFLAQWPNLLEEPDSEKVKVDDVKLKGLIAIMEVLLPEVDPENKATTIQWMAGLLNEMKMMFPEPLILDYEALADYTPPEQQLAEEPEPGKPFAANDSPDSRRRSRIAALRRELIRLGAAA